MGFKDQKVTVCLALFLASAALSAQNGNGQRDSLVRLIRGSSLQLIEKNGVNYRKAVDATFFHNNTYLICDTALWNVDSRIINAEGNVQVVQDGTKLTSDKLDYLIDQDLVQFRGSVVQLEDKDRNILRTRYLDYNTRDSLALFRNGGSMKDRDGQIIESVDGSYDAKQKLFRFQGNVNMFTDSVFIKTTAIDYESSVSRAFFTAPTDFWKEDNMLSAQGGWYDRLVETFFFNGKVHATSKEQEAWCDSLFYYRATGDVHLLGNAQVQDTTRHVSALAGSIFYVDSLSRVTLSRDAAVALRTEEERRGLVDRWDTTARAVVRDTVTRMQVDTVYFGADTLVYRTIPKYLVPAGELAAAKTRSEDIMSDPVREFRKKAAEAAAQAAAQAAEQNAESNPELAARNASLRKQKASEDAVESVEARETPTVQDETPIQDEDIPLDEAATQLDSLSLAPTDSLSLASADSLAVADSLANTPPPDSTKIGFLEGKGNVKIFRFDIQVACDSLRYCDLDSIARFYINPLIWNEGNRQYSADSIAVRVRGNGIDRASLMSNAFIITRETPDLFDQIRSTEVMAYFDSTTVLRRFDALGGANAIFFIKENEEFATVNKVDTKMLSALFEGGELNSIYYFEAPKNDAYPVPQLREADRRMKGFNWQPERKPAGKEDITTQSVRPSEREIYAAHPRTRFVQTDVYFPGYMKKVYAALEASRNRPKGKKSVSQGDTLSVIPPVQDEPGNTDSLSVLPSDSPAVIQDDTPAVVQGDTLSVVPAAQDEAKETPAPSPVPTKAELREKARQERIAAREARWAEKDARDAARLKAKEEARKARIALKKSKAVEKQRLQDAKDAEKLRKYVARYRAAKARRLERERRRALRRIKKQSPEPVFEPSSAPADTIYVKPNDTANGNDPGQIPEIHQGGYPERRELPEPAFDLKTAEPAETSLRGAE